MGISCCKCGKRTDATNTENHGFDTGTTTHDDNSVKRKQSQTPNEIEVQGNKFVLRLNSDGGININVTQCAPHETEVEVGVGNEYSNGYKPTSKRRLFTCVHTAVSLQKYLQKKRHLSASGNFIDCRNIPLRDHVRDIHAFSKWSTSVCQIRFGNKTATGFRVGSRYIMTAYHVVEEIISTVNRDNGQYHFNNHVPALVHRNVFCLFNYFHDLANVRKYYLMASIHFYDKETDTAILELANNPDGSPMPQPFRILGFPEGKFTLLGHMGRAMEYNIVSILIDSEHERTRDDFEYVKAFNENYTSETYEFLPYNTLTNNKRLLFHCKFGKGASGSPGLSVREDGSVVVVTMLLCGYPNWYYDQHIDRNILDNWPKEYCIEQGTNLLSVGNIMRRSNPTLHEDIFCSYPLPVPDIANHD